jgi:hypothetical protein
MHTTLLLAIIAFFKFELEDFKYINDKFRWGFWSGDGEVFYSKAVEAGNMSACKSFEYYRGRKPFLTNNIHNRKRDRICVDTWLTWNKEHVKVTSFSDDNSYFVACHYPIQADNRKPDHIYKITHKDLKSAEAK